MKKNIILLSLSALVILSGCAVTNDHTKFRGAGLTYNANIKDLGNNQYLAAVEASPLAGRKSGAKDYALTNATNFCNKQDKSVKILDTKLSSHLQNGVAHITFTCI